MLNPSQTILPQPTHPILNPSPVIAETMPAAIRGVNYLSGGQSLEGAAARLNALNQARQCAISVRNPLTVEKGLEELCLLNGYIWLVGMATR